LAVIHYLLKGKYRILIKKFNTTSSLFLYSYRNHCSYSYSCLLFPNSCW